jgi:hypothetical protein
LPIQNGSTAFFIGGCSGGLRLPVLGGEEGASKVIQPCAVCQAPVPLNEVEVCNICLSVMHDTCMGKHVCESEPTPEEEKEVWP